MILVDAHVHLHRCFSPEHFLNAAADNVAAAARGMGLPASTPGMLLFTHAAGDDAFGGLRTGSVGHWSLSATQEPISMRAHRDEAPPLTLVAGRQIATAEGLEVLALGAAGPFADHEPMETTIDAVRAQDGIPVLPWGFGKWWRRRGAIVQRLAADRARFPLLFLGDSAGRPRIAPRPRLLAQAERLGRAVLPGTDPLPISGEENKAGRLIFRVERELDTERPFADLMHWLKHRDISPPAFGVYEGTRTFIRRQIEMQLRKRWPAK
ncbi:hypothetical protein [Salinisphaera sp.]|uniref:hypothetical protein n=1 Tax=Salinisphaera sp. TaxID=1914330 RepID=UPI002D79151A|nr:hypothetical protein [Salinisphaera sp.]HET7313791.1 hypothetical protein [Salinisphaera sp.]